MKYRINLCRQIFSSSVIRTLRRILRLLRQISHIVVKFSFRVGFLLFFNFQLFVLSRIVYYLCVSLRINLKK